MRELQPDDMEIGLSVIAIKGPKFVDYNVTAYNAIAIQKDLPLMDFTEHMAFRDRPFKIAEVDLPFVLIEEIPVIQGAHCMKAMVDTRLYKFGRLDQKMIDQFLKRSDPAGF